MWGFGNLKQNGLCLQVSDFEANKVDIINILFGFAEVTWAHDKKIIQIIISQYEAPLSV